MSHFTVDHQGFYLGGEPFYPLIQESGIPLSLWSNTGVVRLSAQLDQDLDWSLAKVLAQEVIASGKFIVWDLDLGLSSFIWIPDDTASFHSFSLALDQFCLEIFPLFKQHTLGVNLYRGQLNIPHQFPYSWWESAFLSGESDSYPLFCVGLFSDYLHRLISILPEEVIPFVLIDVEEYPSFSHVARLFLQERFEYICLGLKGSKGPHAGLCWEEGFVAQGYWGSEEKSENFREVLTGLFLPEDHLWSSSILEQMESTLSYLHAMNLKFRTIEEGKLTEQWDGLDQIVVASRSLVSAQAHRKFLGFMAAGGLIIYADE